jgi:hypothetical protein
MCSSQKRSLPAISGFGVDAEDVGDVEGVGVGQEAGMELVIEFQFAALTGVFKKDIAAGQTVGGTRDGSGERDGEVRETARARNHQGIVLGAAALRSSGQEAVPARHGM